jgi:hypothetical protein
MAETLPEIIERLSIPIPECGCYAWLGHHSRGYAKVRWREDGKRKSGRVARLLCEPIPRALEPDHLCKQKWCVNREHLEPVTHQENVKRQRAYAVGQRQTCEKHGIVLRSYGKSGIRICRMCKTEYQREYRNRSVKHGTEQVV